MANISSGGGSLKQLPLLVPLDPGKMRILDEPYISANYNTFHSQAGASNALDNNNNTGDGGSLCDPATSTTRENSPARVPDQTPGKGRKRLCGGLQK
uniref:Uncharacterized protein n=2 Tax=environmental samples TaxID=151659 RepID=D6PJ97_9ZZZZ|nr:hypothetical protein [uncultured organism MedDCM-OCT-S08-C3]ADD96408.1 hypothetical protein [uncultured organism MedDCM-OCT-S09-C25]